MDIYENIVSQTMIKYTLNLTYQSRIFIFTAKRSTWCDNTILKQNKCIINRSFQFSASQLFCSSWYTQSLLW